MASYTTSLRLIQPATGEYPGSWGTQANNGLTALVDTSVAGTATITMVAADYTLSTANGATDEARAAVLSLTGTPGASFNVIVPAVSKIYVVFNNTGFAQTVKTSAGTGISVPNGASAYLRCNGTDVVEAVNYFGSLSVGTVTGGTFVSPSLTGTPTAPTAAGGTSTTQIATTAYVATNFAGLSSPAFTGTPTVPTAAPGTNTTQAASTSFVATSFAPLASPAFTGTPTAPTATAGVSTTQVATTAFVAATAFSSVLPGQTGNAGKYVTTDGTNASWADVYPAQTGNTGKVLETDGSAVSWQEKYPTQTGNTGNFLQTNGTSALWASPYPTQTGNNGKYLSTNGTTVSWSTVQAATFNEYISSSTWTKPSGATFVMVEAWGAGGGGGSGRRGAAATGRGGGAGGAGGAYTQRLFRASDLGATETVTIGAGGSGGAAVTTNDTNGAPGTGGGNTSFGSWLTAYGGSYGFFGQDSFASDGGSGGGALSANIGGTTGGAPNVGTLGQAFGGGPTNRPSGWGGGGGGSTDSSQVGQPGGCSFQGGPGGGGGGGINTSNAPQFPGAGGSFAGANGGGPIGGQGTGRVGGGGGWVNELGANFGSLTGAYANGQFVIAAANGNGVLISTDGATWTRKPSPITASTPTLGYGNGIWFIGNVGSPSFIYTTTDFVSYNSIVYTGAGSIQAIRYLNGIYIVVGSAGYIATSPDLVTWTTRTSGTSANLFDVTWTGTNYVVCGDSGAIRYSTDLVTWSGATGFAGTGRAIVAGNSGRVVITKNAATMAYYSTDHGQTWTAAATPPTLGAVYPTGLVFGNGTFATVNTSSSNVFTSTDGDTWTTRTTGAADVYGAIAYSGTTWFASSGTNNSNAGISSPDLTTWTNRTSGALSAASGAGGAGGANWGAGGGGGGASLNGNNSGAGGAGAAGRVRVYTW